MNWQITFAWSKMFVKLLKDKGGRMAVERWKVCTSRYLWFPWTISLAAAQRAWQASEYIYSTIPTDSSFSCRGSCCWCCCNCRGVTKLICELSKVAETIGNDNKYEETQPGSNEASQHAVFALYIVRVSSTRANKHALTHTHR